MEPGFLGKLIERLDKIGPENLQTHFLHLARERGLLETIFQSIREGVIVIDGSGLITYSNLAAERLLGLPQESAGGRHVSRFLKEIDWD
ncbi:MAG: PAS domain-containing protein, partial [Kiritimatiellia bacterium]